MVKLRNSKVQSFYEKLDREVQEYDRKMKASKPKEQIGMSDM